MVRAVRNYLRQLIRNERGAALVEYGMLVGLIAVIGTANENLEFTVLDSGSGMDQLTQARAAEPFFTTKVAGKGMGLGLFLVRTFCEQHGGKLSLRSNGVRGTRAAIVLPRAAARETGRDLANPAVLGRLANAE